jgi:predicted nucleic acid-binding protein
VRVIIPAIVDYEVRRGLNHIRATDGIRRLDEMARDFELVPLETPMLTLAAWLWGEARRVGRPGGDPQSLDADVILAAQAILSAGSGDSLTVATTNPKHFRLFVAAERWEDVS